MDGTAATRLPPELEMKVRESTPFALHSSFTHEKGAVLDYTEYRLLRMLLAEQNIETLLTLKTTLNEYRAGKIAIGWHKGTPCIVSVQNEK